jgi:hypothetical protein
MRLVITIGAPCVSNQARRNIAVQNARSGCLLSFILVGTDWFFTQPISGRLKVSFGVVRNIVRERSHALQTRYFAALVAVVNHWTPASMLSQESRGAYISDRHHLSK